MFQLGNVFDLKVGERLGDTLRQPVMFQKRVIGLNRGGETAGDAHARLTEMTHHFAERGILAANQGDIL